MVIFKENKMPFSEQRALAFAEYTLTALLRDAKGSILTVSRSDLAKILQVQKLWPNHIEVVRAASAEQGVGTANLGSTIAFFDVHETKTKPLKVNDGISITDRFEKVYGSRAADEMWESGEYRAGKKL
jgi:hypothetical protein